MTSSPTCPHTLTSAHLWPAASVNARIGSILVVDRDNNPVVDDEGREQHIAASAWLDKNRPVEQMTWTPGEPMLIRGKLVANGGWIQREGVTCFNLYRPPGHEEGDAEQAGLWSEHIYRLYGKDDLGTSSAISLSRRNTPR